MSSLTDADKARLSRAVQAHKAAKAVEALEAARDKLQELDSWALAVSCSVYPQRGIEKLTDIITRVANRRHDLTQGTPNALSFQKEDG